MQVKVLGAERRRRWSYDEKVRLIEETLQAGETVCGVARRHGMAQSLLFTWRRQARHGRLGRRRRAGACSGRDYFWSGSDTDGRAATAVFASCATRQGRNDRDRAGRLPRAR